MGTDPSDQKTEAALPTRALDVNDASTGNILGPYHLLQLIGEGGMGQVWLAEQKQPVRRRVAVKLIKAGMDTHEVVSRFESERQALALMDHPAIAKVFDAGSTPEGRPYFVMEYVAGLPITAYCDKHKLTMRQRMELFILVCEGVQHAHQKAIIHRDLKPSNILITEVDGKPAPRIIDFGIAKATSQQPDAATIYTRLGSAIGTLGYMSPEQARSGGEDIDTRSDVYSLGVVLYELLVGALPLDFNKLAYDEALRRLREQDAPRPSTRLRKLGGDSAVTAQNRGADLPVLARQLQGDADSITLKALEKDRKRRYATPSELAADMGRYLRNEPVAAHPPSAGYRARKYVRRNRWGVAVGAAGMLLLVGFVVAQAVELRNIRRERDRADRITDFMTRMFQVSDPGEARGNTVTAREILDKADQEIRSGLASDPLSQAQMMEVMGTVYANLGLYARAQPLFDQALTARTQLLGPRDPQTLLVADKAALNLGRRGRYAEADARERDVVTSMQKVLGGENQSTVTAELHLATILDREGKYGEAEKLSRIVFLLRTRDLGARNADTLVASDQLAGVLRNLGNLKEAEDMERASLANSTLLIGADAPNTLLIMDELGIILNDEGKGAEAEQLTKQALQISRKVNGPENPETLRLMDNLAASFLTEGKQREAEELYRQLVSIDQRVLGPESSDSLIAMDNLGTTLIQEKKFEEAESTLRSALLLEARAVGKDPPLTADLAYRLATALASLGRKDEALEALQKAVEVGLNPQTVLEMGKDPALEPLRSDARFKKITAAAEASAKPK